jgi:hypothetical protein
VAETNYARTLLSSSPDAARPSLLAGVTIIGLCAVLALTQETRGQWVGTVLYAVQGTTITDPGSGQPVQATPFVWSSWNGNTLGSLLGANSNPAAIWATPNGTPIVLGPTGSDNSTITGMDSSQEVGYVDNQATLWNGTSGSPVDLNPAGFTNCIAFGVAGGEQVGYAGFYATPESGLTENAFLWTGSAASAVNLNPSGYSFSNAEATDGAQQVGIGAQIGASHNHALLWNGSATSYVDLNPSGYAGSFADAIWNGEVGGSGIANGSTQSHATLWTGGPNSAIDLHPGPQFNVSLVTGLNGTFEIGNAGFTTRDIYAPDAYVWSGSAASAFNLQNVLPASGTWYNSDPYMIDSSNNIFGVANGVYGGFSGDFAIEWPQVPEPGSLSLLAVSAGALMVRRRPIRRL